MKTNETKENKFIMEALILIKDKKIDGWKVKRMVEELKVGEVE